MYLSALAVLAAAQSMPAPQPSAAQPLAPPSAQAVPVPTEAPLRVFNREVTVLRADLFGISPAQRVVRAEREIERLTGQISAGRVDAVSHELGRVIRVDGSMVFILQPGDVDPLGTQDLVATTTATVAALQEAIDASRASRNQGFVLRAAGILLVATAILLALLYGLGRLRRRVATGLEAITARQLDRLTLGGKTLVNAGTIARMAQSALKLAYWLLVALMVYEWLSLVLSTIPYTRPWGQQLNSHLLDALAGIGLAILGELPDLGAALLIFFVAWLFMRAAQSIFERIEQGVLEVVWLDAELVRPTRRLLIVAIWVFALVMAYPYLPGAQTDAFKGVSVILGLMLSLGASSLVGQAASGLILMYARTIRVGEYVEVDGTQGTVLEMGAFATRIRTGTGLEVSIPNASIVGTAVKNYSRGLRGSGKQGFVIDTSVTIGYDTSWRQVHAMLLEAAKRTPAIAQESPPQIHQTALSDFYVEYRLSCMALPAQRQPRAEVLTVLHGNIQDVFNEYGVQIMSPNYEGDPEQPKLVAREQWYAAPASRPDATAAGEAPPA
ncbi:mechanosensitive ion channel family protein [Uliginosibacterium sp. H1]|uniref:mechanosensitive ion channel family protein n=1 Tax=Uliginosibacterium sp. H1 TaxID=3114757 RepID=UPI002E1704FA|nr:mechanosensitive ion channel family protein [Uliginosibacterium sp. H1]